MSTDLPDAVEQVMQRMANRSSQTLTLLLGDQVLAEVEPSSPDIPSNWTLHEDGAITLPGLPGRHMFNWAGYEGYTESFDQYPATQRFNLNRLFIASMLGDHENVAQAFTFKMIERGPSGREQKVMDEPIPDTWVYGVGVKTEGDVRRIFESRVNQPRPPWRNDRG